MATFIGAPNNPLPSSGSLTTEQFGLWMQQVIDAMTAVGCPQTADTGQYIPGTTAWPAGGFPSGCLMFRFTDALQATAPIFIRIQLGRGGNYAYNLNYAFQIGVATNGAGSLTGSSISIVNAGNNATSGGHGTQRLPYASFSDGSLFFGDGFNDAKSVGFHFAFSIERTRDAAGALTGEGLTLMYKNGFNDGLWRLRSFLFPSTLYTASTSFCIMPGLPVPPVTPTGDLLLYPHFYNMPDVRQRASSFTARNSDFGSNPTTFTATPFAAKGARTFIQFGSTAGAMTAVLGDLAGYGPCFLWE